VKDCRRCVWRARCFSEKLAARQVMIVDGYAPLLRARRKRLRWEDETYQKYVRHRWRVEGVHGVEKTQHGLRRAVRRGLSNVRIQSYLTAAVMNLKRLAALLWALFWGRIGRPTHVQLMPAPREGFSRPRVHSPSSLRRAA